MENMKKNYAADYISRLPRDVRDRIYSIDLKTDGTFSVYLSSADDLAPACYYRASAGMTASGGCMMCRRSE